MMVKDVAGQEFNAATNSKANAGLTLGIIGTALGGLLAANAADSCGNGLLGGILGKSGGQAPEVVPMPIPMPMPVTEHQYYEDSISNLKGYYTDAIQNQKDFFAYAQGVGDRICQLEQRVAIDETSIAKNFDFMASQNEWQNKFFDEKLRYADLLEQCRIQNATCKCIKGEVYASPADIAEPYIGRRQVIGSYTEPLYGGYFNNCGWNNGCGWNNYNGGCTCY